MLDGRSISRRDFLKKAGAAGMALGIQGGLGGLLAACQGSAKSTTASGPATTTGQTVTTVLQPTTNSLGPSTNTTVSTSRDIRVGLVSPLTGTLSDFGVPAGFLEAKWNEALAAGVQCGDGRRHNLVIIHADTRSDPQQAAAATGDLVGRDRVDAVLAFPGPGMVVPVANVCEVAGVPMITSLIPWEIFVFERQKKPEPETGFRWTYAHAPGRGQIIASFVDLWGQLTTNRTLGLFFPNDPEGAAWADKATGLPPVAKSAGYRVVDPGLYPVDADDFSPFIEQYQKDGCEILVGQGRPADFVAFWRQAHRQGYRPKILTAGETFLFPEALAAMGDIAQGVTTEFAWGPHWPFKSSLTGESCRQLADDYENRVGRRWTPLLGAYCQMEWLVDALKRTEDLDDKNQLIAAIASTKLDTVLGPLEFTAPLEAGTLRPAKNVYTSPMGAGQWVQGAEHSLEMVQVGNIWSEQCRLQAKVQAMVYPG